MSTYETVTVTVPRGQVSALLSYAAGLAAAVDEDQGEGDGPASAAGTPGPRGERRFSDAAVTRAYNGGKSDYWRPFLKLLAHKTLASRQAGEEGWVEWADLHNGIGLDASGAAGMLGAAERRLKQLTPYDKVWEDSVRWFRMPEHVAHHVIELATKHGDDELGMA